MGLREEMLALVDIEKFEAIMDEVNRTFIWEGDIQINTTQLLNKWAENKKGLFIKMGKKLKTFQTIKGQIARPEDFVFTGGEMEDIPLRWLLNSMLKTQPESVQKNRVDFSQLGEQLRGNVRDKVVLLYQKGIINDGMKWTKLVAKLAGEQAAANLAQKIYEVKDDIKEIMLTIDPVDFLFASVNQHGWRSCMSLLWDEDNFQRFSIFSFMVDSNTMLQALVKDKSYYYPEWEVYHYSYIWRRWIFSKDMKFFVSGRQYPYTVPAEVGSILTFEKPVIMDKILLAVKLNTKTSDGSFPYLDGTGEKDISTAEEGEIEVGEEVPIRDTDGDDVEWSYEEYEIHVENRDSSYEDDDYEEEPYWEDEDE
jgi:hypothetical protein